LLFNSYEFIFTFLPITFFIYFYLNHKRLTEVSKGFLVFSSLNKTNSHKFSKKSLLVLGIVSNNIALLAYFKYTDFMIDNYADR